MDEYCSKCGSPIVWITLQNDRRVPLDRFTIEDRFVFDGEKWIAGKAGISHYKTCQRKRRFSLKEEK